MLHIITNIQLKTMKIEKISDIYESLKQNANKKRLVVSYANDSHRSRLLIRL